MRRKNLRREGSIAIVMLTTLVLAAACGSTGSSSQVAPSGSVPSGSGGTPGTVNGTGQVLQVGLYGGSWETATDATAGKAFTAATGATVQYTAGNPSDIAAKIYAAAAAGQAPPVDVIETDSLTQMQLAQRGMILPIKSYRQDVSGIFGNVTQAASTPGYAPPHCNWYDVLAYNSTQFKKLGIPAPTSWSALWNPKLAGHIAVPDISTAMGVPAISAAAGVAAGNPTHLSAGLKKLGQLKPYEVYTSSSTMQTDFANGNIWAGVSADGRAWQLVDSALPIKVVYPTVGGTNGKIGPLAGTCNLDIVKGAKNVPLAAAFIKAAYSSSAQAAFAEATGYTPTSSTALKELVSQSPKWKTRIPSVRNSYILNWKQISPQIPTITQDFNQIMSGN